MGEGEEEENRGIEVVTSRAGGLLIFVELLLTRQGCKVGEREESAQVFEALSSGKFQSFDGRSTSFGTRRVESSVCFFRSLPQPCRRDNSSMSISASYWSKYELREAGNELTTRPRQGKKEKGAP